jgi:tagatose 6-phosphate kinase
MGLIKWVFMQKRDLMSESYILCGGLTPCLQRTLELESVALGAVNRIRRVTETVGGKQINTARMLKSLGAHVRTIGFCGGENGRKMLGLLKAEGLYMESVPTTGNTRTCQTLIDRAVNNVTELVEELPPVSAQEQQAFIEHFMKLRADAALITLSGTLPPGFPPSFYRTLIDGADSPVIIDTHGPALKELLSASPLMVKLNEHELVATFGSESIDKTAQKMVKAGVDWVLVTRGKNGAWKFGTPDVNVLNPIGSGDAVTAGIAFAVSQARPMPEAVQFGLACGAAQAETLISGQLNPSRARELESLIKTTAM